MLEKENWQKMRHEEVMMKLERQKKIIELIENYEIDTQEELASRLTDAGFQITQATVSRDIRDLKLTKISVGKGRQRYIVPQREVSPKDDKYIRVLQDCLIQMDIAQNLLVIKTVSGMAMAAAAALDACQFREVVGCIAGDDTIMCATPSVNDSMLLMDKIKHLLK